MKTPLTDQFSQSVSEVEITKHPMRSFGEACDFARRLETDRARLIEALQFVVNEVSWFVSRQKNLADPIPEDGRIWADILNNDLQNGIALLKELS